MVTATAWTSWVLVHEPARPWNRLNAHRGSESESEVPRIFDVAAMEPSSAFVQADRTDPVVGGEGLEPPTSSV